MIANSRDDKNESFDASDIAREQEPVQAETKKKSKPFCFVLLTFIPPLYMLHLQIGPKASAIFRMGAPALHPLWPILPGLALAFLFCNAPSMKGFRTILHELRHAALILLTGNKLNRFEFYSKQQIQELNTLARVFYRLRAGIWGHITGPLITTAPYYFPLLSIPAIAVCSFLPHQHQQTGLFAVGISIGIDYITSLKDFLNVNNLGEGDFVEYRGGFVFGVPFVLAVNAVTIECTAIWMGWMLTGL